MSIGILLYLDLEFWEGTLKTLTPSLQENAKYFTTRSYLTLTFKQWYSDVRGELTMTLELPNMIYMNTNLDKLLKKISQLESGEQVSLSFKNIEFILPESTILLLSISKQIYDRTHTVVTWLDVKNDMRMYLERIQINKLACK